MVSMVTIFQVLNKIFQATIHKSELYKFSWEDTGLAVVDKSRFSFLICFMNSRYGSRTRSDIDGGYDWKLVFKNYIFYQLTRVCAFSCKPDVGRILNQLD